MERLNRRVFTEDGIQALTMEAGLFCQRGAWILPVTSGQEDRYADSLADLTEEELEWWHKYELTLEEWEFAKEFGLEKEEQFAIFPEMREYFETYPELQTGNTIFAFEGVGDYTGGKNKYHPDGQFGAIFVYCKDGELEYLTKEASTLPDNKGNAVIRDGLFKAVWWNHKGYSSLQLRNFHTKEIGDLPALRYNNDGTTANGIDLHTSDKLTETSNYSAGCLTVNCTDYYYFGVEADFIEKFDGEGDFEDFDWQRDNLKTSKDKEGEEWGYVVVDRQFMSEKNKKIFLGEDDE